MAGRRKRGKEGGAKQCTTWGKICNPCGFIQHSNLSLETAAQLFNVRVYDAHGVVLSRGPFVIKCSG